jgi:hypothetical protein
VPDAIPVFDMARGDDVDLAVALPPAWAAERPRVQVIFEDWDVCGWHAVLESPDGEAVLSFPWQDHVDKMLRGEVPSELPDPALPTGAWDDLDQGWWASVRAVGDAVFIAETDLDRLLDVRGTPVASLSDLGHVELSGVPVLWSRVPRSAWEEAWNVARASCAGGAPAPSRVPVTAPSAFHRLEPEVPGGLGERTELEATPEGPRVLKLHYEFAAGCQGDDLATSHPIFIISEHVGAILQAEGLTGFTLAEMEQSIEPQVHEFRPGLELPTFKWMQVTGQAGGDDVGLDDGELVVSARALRVLRQHAQLSLCDVEPWIPRVR